MPSQRSSEKHRLKEAASVGLLLLKGVAAASEPCPPLKGVANCAAYIIELALKFKSNKSEWASLGRHVEESMAILVDALTSAECSTDSLLQSLANLQESLVVIRTEIVQIQDESAVGRFLSFSRDPEKIVDIRRRLDDSILRFQLQTSISCAKSIQATVTLSDLSLRIDGIVNFVSNKMVGSIKQNEALNYLPYVDGASYSIESGCMDGTRSNLLLEISAWVDSANEPSSKAEIIHLAAVAGAGKSAVAHSVAKAADARGFLGSSFFFQHGIERRSLPRLMMSTIIRDLAGRYKPFGEVVAAALDNDRSLASADLQRQFDKLLLPFSQYLPSSKPIFVVIDGLDEVNDGNALRQLLQLLRSRVPELPGTIRIFVSSRPLEAISRALTPVVSHIRAKEIDPLSYSNQSDLEKFVRSNLNQISEEKQIPKWPDQETIVRVVSRSEGLFTWASVVVNLLKFDAFSPVGVLDGLLSNGQSGLTPQIQMDKIYAEALEVCGKWSDPNFQACYVAVLGMLATAQTPLSLSTMESLYRHDPKLARFFSDILKMLKPLLVGYDPMHNDIPFKVIHLSFREYVTGQSRTGLLKDPFYISLADQNEQMVICCLQVLIDDLDESIPGAGLLDLEQEEIPSYDDFSRVPNPLLYASQYWKRHLAEISRDLPDRICEALDIFTSPCRLHQWIGFVICSRSYQKVTDLIDTVKKYAPNRSAILNHLESDICANMLSNFADRLEYMNRLEESLLATEDIVQIYTTLAAKQPQTFRPDLAKSLCSLSVTLRHLGQREESLAAIVRAVEIQRQLASTLPDAFNPGLAGFLHNLSICLAYLGRREEALKASRESVDIYRLLAAKQPLSGAFEPQLALSINTFSIRLADLGRWEESLNAAEKAIDIRRTLAISHPWAETFNFDLAQSFSNVSLRLSDLGRNKEALKAIKEAVTIYRSLAASQPQAFNHDLAQSLNNMSDFLAATGSHEEALLVIENCIEISRPLAATRPGVFNQSLATYLFTLSERFAESHQWSKALEAIDESVGLFRPLKAKYPEVHNKDLSEALEHRSKCLRGLGLDGQIDVTTLQENEEDIN